MTGQADPRVKAILDGCNIKYEIDGDGDFKVLFELENGRTQNAYINSNTETFAGRELRDVWSAAYSQEGPLPPYIANMLLVKNCTYKAGCWGIMIADEDYAAIFRVQVSADADETELTASLQSALITADAMEEVLTGKDEF